MGMSYSELSVFGRLRKQEKCGPYSMFTKLLQEWGDKATPEEVSSRETLGPDCVSSLVYL